MLEQCRTCKYRKPIPHRRTFCNYWGSPCSNAVSCTHYVYTPSKIPSTKDENLINGCTVKREESKIDIYQLSLQAKNLKLELELAETQFDMNVSTSNHIQVVVKLKKEIARLEKWIKDIKFGHRIITIYKVKKENNQLKDKIKTVVKGLANEVGDLNAAVWHWQSIVEDISIALDGSKSTNKEHIISKIIKLKIKLKDFKEEE